MGWPRFSTQYHFQPLKRKSATSKLARRVGMPPRISQYVAKSTAREPHALNKPKVRETLVPLCGYPRRSPPSRQFLRTFAVMNFSPLPSACLGVSLLFASVGVAEDWSRFRGSVFVADYRGRQTLYHAQVRSRSCPGSSAGAEGGFDESHHRRQQRV
jgi:hypothetical protein